MKRKNVFQLITLLVFFLITSKGMSAPAIFVDLATDTEKGESAAIYPYMQSGVCGDLNLTDTHIPNKDCFRDRTFASTGDTVNVYVRHKPLTKVKVEFSEVGRNTVLKDNLKVLLKVVEGVLAGSGDSNIQGEKPNLVVSRYSYTLTRTRSELSISIDSQLVPEAVVFETLTGPKEHWFLSADFLVTETKQLKYDEENSSLVERNKPSEFFLGVNYMFGDVLNDRNGLFEKLYLKGFIKISSRPLDSYGLGVGYRFNNVGSVFLAYNRFLEDANPGNSALSDENYGETIGIGLSLDLGSALNWLK